MMNPFSEVNWNPNQAERRRFAVSLMVGFPCVAVALLFLLRWRSGAWNVAPPLTVAATGMGLGLLLWLAPRIARPFYAAWYALACCIGFVIGNAALAAIYLLMFAPLGLAMRAMGRRAFTKGFDRNAPTYWRDATPRSDPERYYRQF